MNHPHQAELDKITSLMASGSPMRWLFSGDSITHGARHTYGTRDYTEHFSERVRFEMARLRDHVIKTGCSGWRVTQLLADIDWCILQYRPHVVSFNFGMNDCAAGPAGLAVFRDAYRRAIETVRTQCQAAVVVHIPNPILPGDPVRNEHLPAYIDACRAIAQETASIPVDHPAAWQGKQLWYRMSDAIHPNDVGHRAMAHQMLRVLGLFDSEKSDVCRLFVPL